MIVLSVEIDLKNLIIERFGTVKAFSQSVGLPNSTLDSIFRRGVLKASVANIIKICDALEISADGLGDGKIVFRSDSLSCEPVLTPSEAETIKKYRALDERGKAAVDATLEREYVESTRFSAVAADAAETVRTVANAVELEKHRAGAKK